MFYHLKHSHDIDLQFRTDTAKSLDISGKKMFQPEMFLPALDSRFIEIYSVGSQSRIADAPDEKSRTASDIEQRPFFCEKNSS
jgi:hypothetical protein